MGKVAGDGKCGIVSHHHLYLSAVDYHIWMPQVKIRTIGMLGFGGVAAKTQHTVLFLPELPIDTANLMLREVLRWKQPQYWSLMTSSRLSI
jgi:hypothetical protein